MAYQQEFDRRRRELLKISATFGALPLLGACGGGSGNAAAAAAEPALGASPAAAPPVSPSPPPIQVQVTGAYRSGQTYLFQSIGVAKYPSTLGGSDYNADGWGPLYSYVDAVSGWAWAHPGGDWIDANGVSQGPAAWASFDANSASGETAAFRYTGIDVTALMQYCRDHEHWAAFIVTQAPGSQPRGIAGPFTVGQQPPVIRVTYQDGSAAALACRVVAANTGSSSIPSTIQSNTYLPAFVEFERPGKPVSSASMDMTVTSHWSGNATITLFLCDPPMNSQPVTGASGLALAAGSLDAGITSVPGVIGAQRYVDGASLSDFALDPSLGTNFGDEDFYDPSLWGGVQNLAKWPHTAVGKWVNPPSGLSLVGSSYQGEGFAALASGLGALKLVMPNLGITTGQEVGYSGGAGIHAKLFMPYADMGLLDHIFVRYYLRFGTPYTMTPANIVEVRQSGAPQWAGMGGKFGIAPSHTTTYGGNSGTSGGGYGWQMRHAWHDCEAAQGGPLEGGCIPGWHLYDFQSSNPPGYRYGGESQRQNNWGQMGGLGGMLYAGRWYCIETELKLNAVNPNDNSFTPDGELRTWIDGRLTYERTGMVFRTLPIYDPGHVSDAIRPMRQLGIKDLWWNWYNGGTTPNTVERTVFTTALVWARQRIGPMR